MSLTDLSSPTVYTLTYVFIRMRTLTILKHGQLRYLLIVQATQLMLESNEKITPATSLTCGMVISTTSTFIKAQTSQQTQTETILAKTVVIVVQTMENVRGQSTGTCIRMKMTTHNPATQIPAMVLVVVVMDVAKTAHLPLVHQHVTCASITTVTIVQMITRELVAYAMVMEQVEL